MEEQGNAESNSDLNLDASDIESVEMNEEVMDNLLAPQPEEQLPPDNGSLDGDDDGHLEQGMSYFSNITDNADQ